MKGGRRRECVYYSEIWGASCTTRRRHMDKQCGDATAEEIMAVQRQWNQPNLSLFSYIIFFFLVS